LDKEIDVMTCIRTLPALTILLALAAPLPALGQQSGSVFPPNAKPGPIFNVRVQTSKLAPEVTAVGVQCAVKIGDRSVALSETASQPVVNAGFNGVITAQTKFLTNMSMELLTQDPNATYECWLQLLDGHSHVITAYASPPGPNYYQPPHWVYPQPGTPFVRNITGPFPPRPTTAR
jgi:hypothetical protein